MRGNNSEWLKCFLSFMSKGGTLARNYIFFRNLRQFTKIYVTNLFQANFGG